MKIGFWAFWVTLFLLLSTAAWYLWGVSPVLLLMTGLSGAVIIGLYMINGLKKIMRLKGNIGAVTKKG